MSALVRLLLLVAVVLGSTPANASLAVTGTEPGCLSPGGPTPETFCNSAYSAALNTTNGFGFSLMFQNQSFIETLLSGNLEVSLFFTPSDFPLQVLQVTSFTLLDLAGNDLGITFTRESVPLELRLASSSPVSDGTIIAGLELIMTCNNAVPGFEGACDAGLTFTSLAIAMDDGPNGGHSLRTGTVPEPTTLTLFGLGLAALSAAGRKKLTA